MSEPEDTKGKRLSHLRHLLIVCRASSDGYKQAAITVQDKALSEVMMRYASQREAYIRRIVDIAHNVYGLGMDDIDSTTEFSQMGWDRLERQNQTDKDILQACERADAEALQEYRTVIESPDLKQVENVVQAQRNGIFNAWVHLRELQKLYDQELNI